MTLTPEESWQEWKAELIRLTSEKTKRDPSEIKIKDEAAKEWFDSGATPYQCFRETYQIENDGI